MDDSVDSDDAAGTASALLLMALATMLIKIRKRRRRRATRKSPPWNWQEFKASLSDRECISLFRMDVASLEALHDRLGKYLTTHAPTEGERSCGHSTTSMQRLCVALRYLAGGAHQDIRRVFAPISVQGIYNSVDLVVGAVNHEFGQDWTFPWGDRTKLEELEKGFRALSPGGSQCWLGQVGAVDGMDISQGCPPTDDAGRYYVSRKGGYMLLLLAIADADRRILWWDVSRAPTTHDKTAFMLTRLGAMLSAGQLLHPFFVSGDAAFRMSSPSLMCPVPAGWAQWDSYNYVQSSLRMPIECAFGILYKRWGLLWRPMIRDFASRSATVSCLIRLNNWCIDRAMDAEIPIHKVVGKPPRFDRHGRVVQAVRQRDNASCEDMLNTYSMQTGELTGEARRATLRDRVAQAGIVRPPRRGRSRRSSTDQE